MKDYLEAGREQGLQMGADMARKICTNFILAVALLHAKGFAHLDVKPENVVLRGEGEGLKNLREMGTKGESPQNGDQMGWP